MSFRCRSLSASKSSRRMKTSPRTSSTGAVTPFSRFGTAAIVRTVCVTSSPVSPSPRVAACTSTPRLVAQVDRQAVELHLGGVGDRRVVVAEAERLADPRVELLGAGGAGVGLGVDREHRHGVAHRHQAFEHRADHALRRRVGRDELGMLGLDRLQLLEQRVVVGVGNLRRVEHVVGVRRDARAARAARRRAGRVARRPARSGAGEGTGHLRRRRLRGSRSRSGPTRAARSRRCRAPRRRRAAARSPRWRAETRARAASATSRIRRLTMPRAGRPVMSRVSAVCRAASLISAGDGSRWWSLRAAQVRRTDLDHRRAEAQRGLDAGAVGDAAGGDHRDAQRADELRQRARRCRTAGSGRRDRKWPRWPPASSPCAITASTPRCSSQSASSTVVALERMRAPLARTRSSSGSSGSPKWKLTTGGRSSSISSAARGVERKAAGTGGHRVDVEAELAVVRRERLAPRRVARRVGDGRAVAEEVEVERHRSGPQRGSRRSRAGSRPRRASRTAASRGRRRRIRRSRARSSARPPSAPG